MTPEILPTISEALPPAQPFGLSPGELTVCVLTFNEEANIGALLDSLLAQDVEPDTFSVLIIDNGSTDRTAHIVEAYANRFEKLRFIVNRRRGIAISRNIALHECKTEIIAFTDADCIVPRNWVARLWSGHQRHFKTHAKLAAVGGGNVPVNGSGRFATALGITLRSFFGSHGSTQGMIFDEDLLVEHIPTLNICYRREALLALGGFDESFLMVCEDPELNHRLCSSGHQIVFLADCIVEHKMRPNLREWLRNVHLYGSGRAQIIRKHADHMRPKFAVPPLLVFGLATMPGFLLPYQGVTFGIATYLTVKARRLDCLPWAWLILTANPIAFGLGMLREIVTPSRTTNRRWHRLSEDLHSA